MIGPRTCDYGDPMCPCVDGKASECDYISVSGRLALFVPPGYVDEMRRRWDHQLSEQRRNMEADFRERRARDIGESQRRLVPFQQREAQLRMYADSLRSRPSGAVKRDDVLAKLEGILNGSAGEVDLDRED